MESDQRLIHPDERLMYSDGMNSEPRVIDRDKIPDRVLPQPRYSLGFLESRPSQKVLKCNYLDTKIEKILIRECGGNLGPLTYISVPI